MCEHHTVSEVQLNEKVRCDVPLVWINQSPPYKQTKSCSFTPTTIRCSQICFLSSVPDRFRQVGWGQYGASDVYLSKALDAFHSLRWLIKENQHCSFTNTLFCRVQMHLNEIITQSWIKCYSSRFETDINFGMMILHLCTLMTLLPRCKYYQI